MTLSIAWIRSVGEVEELVFASDSRLRNGQAWDCCPKIMSLPRSDCLISFAGDTQYAYPLMLQMIQAIDMYAPSSDRRTDITVAKRHALEVFNQMRSLIHDFPRGVSSAGDPEAGFLFGGYSWRQQEFLIWQLHYDASIDRYTFRPVHKWAKGNSKKAIAFTGDVTVEAKNRLIDLLRDRGKLRNGGFDMEPFEVLRDMIRSNEYPTVGGAPQVAKVYRFLRSQHFAVRWPDASGLPHALGRPALTYASAEGEPPVPYERFDVPVIDPDSPERHSRHSKEGQDVLWTK
ncbi:hypothetical protein QFZ61_001044 [Arthrobacter sp. B3I4]|nr:hypothetical protein [Arthrobacter sp. B3I4]